MSDWAARWSITLVGGSIMERAVDSNAIFNTEFVFAPDGSVIGAYRKVHLFDVDVGGRRYRESDLTTAGTDIVVISVAGWTIGISLCYDIRFPELYSALANRGAHAIVVPAYFTLATGRDHWHVLLRARAIENQMYILAAGQWGEPAPGQPAYGRSLVCDPWGLVIAQAGDEDTVITAELNDERVRSVRRNLPSLAHRRPEVYASWTAELTDALA
jgi:predicted amidohydrolase